MIKINVINASTVISDTDAAKCVAALEMQVGRDFSAAWGIFAELIFVPKGGPSMPGAWQLAILDNSDQAQALGYHDITSEGLPIGKIFAKTDLDNGSSWTVTASHELLEMLADPDINLTVFREDIGQLWSYEVGDTCEADELGYLIDGILVSDFVFPSWFEGFRSSGPFDQRNKISNPFELLPGGYVSYFDIRSGLGWQQQTARTTAKTYRMRPPVGSRRERRRTPRSEWIRSVPVSQAG